MKVLNTHRVPSGFELHLNAEDSHGVTHLLCAHAIDGSGDRYFETLSGLAAWKSRFDDRLAVRDGRPIFVERVLARVAAGDVSVEVGTRMIVAHYALARD